MGRRTHIGRLAVFAVMPLLVLSGAVPGLTLFRCQHDHRVRLTTCCPDEGSDADELDDDSAKVDDAAAALDKSGCCEATAVKLNQAPFAAPADGGQPATPPLTVALSAAPNLVVLAPVITAGRSTFLNTGPPVRLRTLALLI